VFNGPVFKKDDATYRSLLLPRQFWKIIVMQGDDGAPNAVGFLLSQATLIADLPQENFDPGEFEPFQVKIADIEQLTRLNFGDLRKHDPLNIDGAERFFERDVPAVSIRGPADIVVHSRI
jgi:endonuclease G